MPAYKWKTQTRQSWTVQSSTDTTDPAPAVSNQESSEGLSVITPSHLIRAVGAHEKPVFIDTHPVTF